MIEKLIDRYKDKPVLFVKEVIGGTPEPEQIKMLNSIASNRMVSVKAGHGVGKTTTLSWIILWFMFTRPYPKIPCTAPTMHQLRDILWAEISKWLNKSDLLRNLFVWTIERLTLKGKSYEENWFAVARTATKPDAMQGFHSESLLFVLDEASGINDIIFEPILGALTGDNTKLIMVGNPTKINGFFYKSHTTNRDMFDCITLNAENSKRVSKDFVQSIIKLYGKESDPYRVRVLGEFPKAEADTFIPLSLLEPESLYGKSPNALGELISIGIGVDVARFGDDESAIYKVERYTEGYLVHEPNIIYKNTTVELTGLVKQEIRSCNTRYPNISVAVNVDGGGVGAGVVDELGSNHNDLDYSVNEKTFGGGGGVLDDEPILYTNDTGLMWGNVKRLLMKGKLFFVSKDEELISQLATRKYTVDEDGQIKLERKADMKKRGIGSPDRADGLALALSENIQGYGIATISSLRL